MSRPRVDRVETVLRVLEFLDEHPHASGSQVARSLRIRKTTALRIVRRLRRRERRFPNGQERS